LTKLASVEGTASSHQMPFAVLAPTPLLLSLIRH
jgi:hypothetical protein